MAENRFPTQLQKENIKKLNESRSREGVRPPTARDMLFMSIRHKKLNWREGFVFQYIPGEIETGLSAKYSEPKAEGTKSINPQWRRTTGTDITLTIFLNDYGEYVSRRRELTWRSVEENIALLESFIDPETRGARVAAYQAAAFGLGTSLLEGPPLLEFFTGFMSMTCVMTAIKVTRKMLSSGQDGKKVGAAVRAEVEITLSEREDPEAPRAARRGGSLRDAFIAGENRGSTLTGRRRK